MATYNLKTRTIEFKIIYFGSDDPGADSCLEYIYSKALINNRSDMVNINSESNKILNFTLNKHAHTILEDLQDIKGYSLSYSLMTIPYSKRLSATRRLSLRSVDGLVFVVNCSAAQLEINRKRFNIIKEGIAEQGLRIEDIPLLVQYCNKDVSDALSVYDLRRKLDISKFPHCESVDGRRQGIFECLRLIAEFTYYPVLKIIKKGRYPKKSIVPPKRDIDSILTELKKWDETGQKGDYVFVSYVNEDRPIITKLVADLESHGVNVWLDTRQLKPGNQWKDTITKAIKKGAYFLACFSENYWKRGETYMNIELREAITRLKNKRRDQIWFIPVRLTSCDMPDIDNDIDINEIQGVDLHRNWNLGIAQILVTVKG